MIHKKLLRLTKLLWYSIKRLDLADLSGNRSLSGKLHKTKTNRMDIYWEKELCCRWFNGGMKYFLKVS